MRSRVSLLVGLALTVAMSLLCGGCTGGQDGGSDRVPMPEKPQSDRVLGYVALPGIEKAVQDIVSVVRPFAPDEADPVTLKTQLGSLLGDPQLEHLDRTKPIVAVAFRPEGSGSVPNPPVAFYIPAKTASPYAETLTEQGAQVKFTQGVLLAAQYPQDLEIAEKNLSFYRSLEGRIAATGRLYLHVGRLLDVFGPMLDAQMGGLVEQMKAGMEGLPEGGQVETLAAILAAELQGFLSLARECEEVQADITLSASAVRFDKVVVAKPGSMLGAFFSATAARPGVSTSSLRGDGLFAGDFHLDSASLGALARHLLAAMRKSPEVARLLPADVVDPWTDLSWWSGDAAMRMATVEGKGFTTDYVLGIQDAEQYLALVERSAKLLEPGSALGDLYRGMGLDLSVALEREVRRHGDMPVHRFKMTLETREGESEPPLPTLDLVQGMFRDYELAIVNGRGLMSQDPSQLDRLIDAAKAGAKTPLELAAARTFGPGRHGYLDYDVVGLVKAMFAAMPALSDETAALENVTVQEPFAFAVTFAETRVLVQGAMPLAPFVEIVNKLEGK